MCMMGQRGRSDEDLMLFFKVFPCNKEYNHDFAACFNTHKGDKAVRRCLLQYGYGAKMCPDMKNTGKCPRGDNCNMTHNLFEYWLHPMRYRTKMCKDAAKCTRPYCFFAHHESELRQPTPAPQPLASFATMVAGAACSSSAAEHSSAAAAAAGQVAVTAPATPSKRTDSMLLRQLSDQQRELLLSLDGLTVSSGSLFSPQDSSLNITAGTLLGPLAGNTGDSSSTGSSSSSLPIIDLPTSTAAALFPATANTSSPLLGFSGGDPSPLTLEAISNIISQPLPGLAGMTAAALDSSPRQLFQQQQQQRQQGPVDPAALAALLQRMDMAGQGPAARAPPPPPPAGMVALTRAGSLGSPSMAHMHLAAARQQAFYGTQQQQLVQLAGTPAPIFPAADMQQLQLQPAVPLPGAGSAFTGLQLQQIQHMQEAMPSPGAAPTAANMGFAMQLPAATLGLVAPPATTALSMEMGPLLQQQFPQW